jgi:hypothetical protein
MRGTSIPGKEIMEFAYGDGYQYVAHPLVKNSPVRPKGERNMAKVCLGRRNFRAKFTRHRYPGMAFSGRSVGTE